MARFVRDIFQSGDLPRIKELLARHPSLHEAKDLVSAAVCVHAVQRLLTRLLAVMMQEGWTPLHFAADNGRLNVARFLAKDAGAAVEDKNNVSQPSFLCCVS